jgi:hypothetical protein
VWGGKMKIRLKKKKTKLKTRVPGGKGAIKPTVDLGTSTNFR